MPRLNPLHTSAWVGLHCFDERFHTISTGSTEEGVIGRGRVGEAEKGWVAEGLWVGEDDGCGGGIGLRYQLPAPFCQATVAMRRQAVVQSHI